MSVAPAIGTGPVLLDAYAAVSCPVKTRHAFDPGAEAMSRPPDPAAAGRATARRRFVSLVLDTWARARPDAADLRTGAELVTEAAWGSGRDPADQAAATLRAMAAGAPVILGGRLPRDPAGHRTGSPHALVRGEDRADGRPGYHPVLVEWHKITVPRAQPEDRPDAPAGVRWSGLARPAPAAGVEHTDLGLRLTSREADFLRLAHHHRLLQAAGFGAEPYGAVIGTDRLLDEPVLVWADLDAPVLRTADPADPRGWRAVSALERYAEELDLRLAVAEAARAGDRDSPAWLRPVVVEECATCPWWPRCRDELDPDDLGWRIERGRLDRVEIGALRERGIETVAQLAAAPIEDLLAGHLRRTGHRPDAELRLRRAARRAGMLRAGRMIERETEGPIEVPGADLEIDFDVESAVDGRIYLWGFAVTDRRGGHSAPAYVQFSRFTELDRSGELELAAEALGWLRDLAESAPSVLVYHYSGYEVAMIDALAAQAVDQALAGGADHAPILTWAAGYALESFVDLLPLVQAHFFGASGLGLKLVAGHTGFRWRDADPGGLNSQNWFHEAVHAASAAEREGARRRVLAYNEDDVLATAAVRAWLRAQ